jgi:hypothetical protein
MPARTLGEEGPPGKDGLPKATSEQPWKIFYGARSVDSLSYPHGKVVQAARRQLETDHWQIYAVDSARGVVISRWRALGHPLLALFMGKVRMRCAVHIQPLGPNRSLITFRADIASHGDLTANPLFGEAKRAYSEAAQEYLIKVRQYLNDHRRG